MYDQEATQNSDDLWTDWFQKQMRLTGMIGSPEGWNDLVVMSSLIPAHTSSIQFPLDQHDGSYKEEASLDGNKFNFPHQQEIIFFQLSERCQHQGKRIVPSTFKEEEECIDIIQPKHLPAALLFILCVLLSATLSHVFTLIFM